MKNIIALILITGGMLGNINSAKAARIPETIPKNHATIVVGMSSDRSAGEEVQIPVSLLAGYRRVCAVKANVKFDAKALEVTGIETGNVFSFIAANNFSNETGEINFTAGAPGCSYMDTTLYTIKFRLKEASKVITKSVAYKAAISVAAGEVAVIDEGTEDPYYFPVEYVNGYIKINYTPAAKQAYKTQTRAYFPTKSTYWRNIKL